MIRWEKSSKHVKGDGTTVIIYKGCETDLCIMSVKQQIPHANRPGSWAHTTFELYKNGEKIADAHSLTRAKEIAEEELNGAKE